MRAWLNGQILDPVDRPALSVLDHGITVGDGAFETVQIVNGEPFALTRHLDRLILSATGIGLTAPDTDAIRAGAKAVIAGQDLPNGLLRITVTAGRGPLGSGRFGGEQTVIVIAQPTDRPGPSTSVVTVPWPRNERGALAGLKTTSYAENALLVSRAREEGATEAILPNTLGELCEGTGSNVFYVVDGELVTPTLASGCLSGITRALLTEWCDVVERDDTIDVLQAADEVFLSSTIRCVLPVHEIDHRRLEAPGPVTQEVLRTWERRSAANLDP
ncbi:MAG: aminotransferase class IV [Nocardioidaceae bacterium]